MTVQASAPVPSPPLDLERFRPAIHYTADRNWLNDPNGLVYYKGLYHLYYQYNPHGNVWGNMSWGHASSPDLATWTEQPVAIEGDPDEDIFSGSIVVDESNTSGFGTAGVPPLVAIYTSAFTELSSFAGLQAQSLAYSLDDGHTWTKHDRNPVLNRQSPHFRDPKVFRYTGPAGTYWVMVAVEARDHKVVLYRSADLKHWDYLSSFGPANATGGVWECPDLFPLPLDGTPDNLVWVLVVNLNPGGVAGGSGGQYFLGSFDGVSFTLREQDSESNETADATPDESSRLREYNWLDWGRDYYAAVSFSGVPGDARIMIAWMNNWDYGNDIPTSPWRSAMSLPRAVRLETVDGVPRLLQEAIEHKSSETSVAWTTTEPITVTGTEALPREAWGQVLRIDVSLRPGRTGETGLWVRGGPSEGTFVGYDTASGCLVLNRQRSGLVDFNALFASVETAPVRLVDGLLTLRIYVDRCSVEVFADHGSVTVTDQIFPDPTSQRVSVHSSDGTGVIESLTIRSLDV